jgi:hypothetical protein
MIMTIPLQDGTLLANVRWAWITAGIFGATQSSGITQPDVNHALFRVDVAIPPVNAEEVIAWDQTDLSNWNVGSFVEAFLQFKLSALPPGTPISIVPLPPADVSLCRVFGYFETYDNLPAVNLHVSFDLVALPSKSERVLVGPSVKATTDDTGTLMDAVGNPYVDLQRNDLLIPPTTIYHVNCTKAGFKNTPMTLAADLFDLSTLIT